MTSKTFGQYTAEIEPNDGREGVNCYISKGRYSASLECAADTGVLTDNDTGDESPIGSGSLKQITAWARANGF